MNIKSIFKSTYLNLIASFSIKITLFITAYLLANYSSDANLANFGLVIVTLGAFQSFITMGLGVTAVRLAVKSKNSLEEQNKLFSNLLFLFNISFCVFSCLIFCFKDFIFQEVLVSPYIYHNLAMFLVVLYLQCAIDIKMSFNIGLGRFFSNVIGNVFGAIGFIAIIVLMLFSNKDIDIYYSWIALGGIGFLVHYILDSQINLTSLWNVGFKSIGKKSLIEILNFSLPVFSASLVIAPVNLIVIGFYSKGADSNSIISVLTIVNQVLGMFTVLPVLFSQVIASRINLDVDYHQVRILGLGVFVISSFLVLVFGFGAEYFLKLYSLDIEVKFTLLISLWTGVLLGVQSQFDSYNLCKGGSRSHLFFNIIFSFIFVMFTYFLEKTTGNYASSRFFAYFLRVVVLIFYMEKVYNKSKGKSCNEF